MTDASVKHQLEHINDFYVNTSIVKSADYGSAERKRSETYMRKSVKLVGILAVIALVISIVTNVTLSENTIQSASITKGSSSANNGDNSESTYDKLKEAIILYVGSPVAYVNGTETRIDPADIEVTPVIINNVRMVPVRFISESLGASVHWDQSSFTASIIMGNKSYKFTHGSKTMMAGNIRYSLDIAVQTIKGRTFVPLNKFLEILGKKAFYDRGLIIISSKKNVFDRIKDKDLISEWIPKLSYLPIVGSHDKLMSLIEEGQKNGVNRYGGIMKKSFSFDESTTQNSAKAKDGVIASAATATEAVAGSESGLEDYSATNVQVQGVDEGDIVKTDGDYIYQVNKQRVVITKVNSPQSMKILSTISYTEKNLNPQELYLHDQKLIIIGSSNAHIPIYKNENGISTEKYSLPRFTQNSVKVLIYDISDRGNVKLLREVELEGSYISSRKVGSALYLVANDYIDYYRIQNGEINVTPSYRDTMEKGEYVNIDYDSIRYFPGMVDSNYLIVAGINVDGNEAANVSTYLGAGQNIYASVDNLYVAVTNYSKVSAKDVYEENTQVFKFGMKDAQLTYLCKGEVPGTILNQFSMDEHDDHFRIATTKGSTWATDERISKNGLYILDDMLSITGRVEDMAPGERIYSVRFMGKRAYVVTFKNVDPLFVIDLKNPIKPAILGALKIPGYSDYLHPYDENHIIGFGKDTIEMKGQAYYQGMKIALFDVTNVSKPIQKFTEMIGDRGTDSELLRNHKALLFSKEKNLLAFPVTLMEVGNSSEKVKVDSLQYGEFTFQGAFVYSLDIAKGFKLKGRITHISNDDYLKAGNSWYNNDRNVQRIIYIGDTLFTLSNGMIKANAMEDLKEKGSVTIP